MPPSHLGQNLCIWRVVKQQQPLGSTHLVLLLQGIHVDVSVQVMPVLALENLPGEGGKKSHQSGALGTGATNVLFLKISPMWGWAHRGRGDSTAFSSESSNLGCRSQLLTWGKGWVGESPTPALARPGGPPSPGTHREGARHSHQADKHQDTPHGCCL